MATTTMPINNVENSILSSMFNIQYPNCGRGMFSLREPFKDMATAVVPYETRSAGTQPTDVNRIPSIPEKEKSSRQKSKRNAEVQCTLLTPNNHHDMAVQTKTVRQRTRMNYIYDDEDDLPPPPPRHYRHRKLPLPAIEHQKIYEIRDIESPPLQAMPMYQTFRRREVPRARYPGHGKPIVEYPDDDDVESDYDDERIVYARRPRKTIKKTYLPPNVRMVCVRDDINRGSH